MLFSSVHYSLGDLYTYAAPVCWRSADSAARQFCSLAGGMKTSDGPMNKDGRGDGASDSANAASALLTIICIQLVYVLPP